MARPLVAGLAPDIVLAPGYVLRVTALDPSSGAVVAGVTVSDVSLQVQTIESEAEVAVPPPIAPLFAYGPAG